jgi:hypothetical protein
VASPEQFSKNIGDLATSVVRNADKTVRKAALAIDQAVVLQTPVDTGRARANWIASLNEASDSTVEAGDKTGQGSIVKAAGVIAQYNGDRDSSVHLTNNLPYIQKLNEGSSVQAPMDFVRKAAMAGAKAVQGAELLKPMVD